MASTTPSAEDGSDFSYFDYFAAIGADIVRLFAFAWRERTVFFLILAVSIAIGAYMAVFSKSVYHAETLLIARSSENPGGLGRVLGSGGGGGISSLIGLSGDKSSQELMAALKARNLIYPLIKQYGVDRELFPKLWDKQAQRWHPITPGLSARLASTLTGEPLPPTLNGPTPEMSYDAFMEHASISQDTKSDVIHLTFEWTNPYQAAQWLNVWVTMLNDARRQDTVTTSQARIRSLQAQLATTSSVEVRQALIQLIQNEAEQIVAAQSERQFALRVIDPAVPLTERVWPKRGLILILSLVMGAAIGFCLALIWALFKDKDLLPFGIGRRSVYPYAANP